MLPSLTKILRLNSSHCHPQPDKRASQARPKALFVVAEDSVRRHRDSLKRLSDLKLPSLPDPKRRKIEQFAPDRAAHNSEAENVV